MTHSGNEKAPRVQGVSKLTIGSIRRHSTASSIRQSNSYLVPAMAGNSR